MVDLCQANNIIPVFASLLPIGEARRTERPPTELAQVNKWMQEFCPRNNYVYVDYFTPLSQGGMLDPSLSDDPLHPNANEEGVGQKTSRNPSWPTRPISFAWLVILPNVLLVGLVSGALNSGWLARLKNSMRS